MNSNMYSNSGKRCRYDILALDIDGTLTTSEKVISPKTKEAVIDLQERGVKVVIASGRSEYGFRHIADELEFGRFGSYVMSFNGGKVLNYATNEVIYDNPLPFEMIPEIYSVAVEHGLGIIGYDKEYLVSGNGIDKYQEYDAWATQMKLKEVDNFPVYFKHTFNKCLLTGEPDKLREALPHVQKHFEGRLNVFLSEEFFIEVLPFGIHKAAALENMVRVLGSDRSRIVCCGDGLNDLTMIEYAGLGVAMANANPKVIEAADYVTKSNDEDGIVQVIEEYFNYV